MFSRLLDSNGASNIISFISIGVGSGPLKFIFRYDHNMRVCMLRE